MATSKFYQEIKEAQIERQVEDVYNKGLLMYFPNTTITYPWNCDGMIATKTDSGKLCKLIIEYKLDEVYQDARTSNERYVYTKLQGLQLSPIAQKVLDKAVELTKK